MIQLVSRYTLCAVTLALGMLIPGAAFADRITYEVAPGDTLLGIALEYGVSVEDLRRWNRVRGDIIQIGQELVINTSRSSSSSGGDRTREQYVVRSGDTGLAIARRFNTTLRELQRWNSRADLDRLRIGQELYVYVEVGGTGSGSRGTPNRGRLRGGIQLSDGAGYTVRNPERAYAVPGTIAALRNGIARVTARFVEVPDIVIHDLSYERGGSMRPHASHQNGLDVDASYYHLDAGELSEWRDVEPEELDVRLQWYLFKSWIDLGQVEYLFVDWELQAVLYDYAAARGASPEQLDEWFQYPTRGSQGILRHEPGHDDHFHVRFHAIEE